MPNASGNNGYGEKIWPPDDVLREFFLQLAFQNGGLGVPAEQQMILLDKKLGFQIGRSKFYEIRKRLQIPSVRKNPTSMQEQLEALNELSEKNPDGSWGVAQTRGRLAQTGVLVKRRTVRDFGIQNHPEAVDRRMKATGHKIHRKALNLFGLFHQIHWDGHEKMSWQALQLGDKTGLSIYGGRCGWSSRIVKLVLVPNVRCSKTIGHLFLDWIEEEGYRIPLTNFSDKGTEVGQMMGIQTRLRALADPTIDTALHPACCQVKSVHNTPIEALWRWHRQADGHSIKEELLKGNINYNPAVPFHAYLFYWVWVPYLQTRLDDYRGYYNSHALQKQHKKNAPTGVSPDMMNFAPEMYDIDAHDRSIKVEKEWVDAERECLGGIEMRNALFEWYPPAFDVIANEAWEELGQPQRRNGECWTIFRRMSEIIMQQDVVWNI